MPLPLEDVERILYQDKKFIDKSEPVLSKVIDNILNTAKIHTNLFF